MQSSTNKAAGASSSAAAMAARSAQRTAAAPSATAAGAPPPIPQPTSVTTTPSACLQSLVEERLTNLIRDATSVQRHAKRARLHPIGGGGSSNNNNNNNNNNNMVVKRRLHASDVNMALQLRDCEPLYGTGVSVVGSGGGDDAILDLAEYVRQPVTTQPPSEIAASMHWLAVQGQTPEIPQNVSKSASDAMMAGVANPFKASGGTSSSKGSSAGGAKNAGNKNPLQIQQLQMAVLSEELQMYYAHVTMALESNNNEAIHSVLQSLSSDRGLQELVPFLMHYSETALLRQVDHSVSVIQMILALLQNPNVHLELHFDKVIKPLMTCIVTTVRRRGDAATTKRRYSKAAPHWAIRQWACLAVVTACQLFHEYTNFRSGVLQLTARALDPSKSLPTQYGGLIALRQFGAKVVDALGVDRVRDFWPHWQQALLENKSNNHDREEELIMCVQAALEALSMYFQGISVLEQTTRHASVDWYDALGDAVTPMVLMAEENNFAYTTCFV